MLTAGTLLQNRYLIVRLLGRGGMGAVYEAQDQRLGNTVALKETFFSDYEMCSAFEREARLLAKLHHPALPVVSDHFVEGSGQFLVMQYIAGKDLHSLLNDRGSPFLPGEVLRWADQLLDALEYLHSQQPPIIHRDIKPQNLKLTPRGQIILLDFGLAKGEVAGMSHISTSYSVKGYTPAYAPPEQIHGKGTDPRSDLYSLAATLYNLVTGLAPADALTRLVALPQGEPDPLVIADELNPQVPSGLAAVLHRAMSLNRDHRPSSASDMRRALNMAGSHTEMKNEPPTFVSPRNVEARQQGELPTTPASAAKSDPARMAPTAADLQQDARTQEKPGEKHSELPPTVAVPQQPTAPGATAKGTSPAMHNPPVTPNSPAGLPTMPISPPTTGPDYNMAAVTTIKPAGKPIVWVIVVVLIVGAIALIYYLTSSGNSSDKKATAGGNEPHIEAEIEAMTTPPAPMLGSHREAWVEANKLIGNHYYHVVRCRYQISSSDISNSTRLLPQPGTPPSLPPINGIKVFALFHSKDGSRILDRNSNYSTASGQIGVQGESMIVYKGGTTYYDIKLYLPQSALPDGDGHYAVIEIQSTDGKSLATYKSEPFNSGMKYVP